MQYSTTSEIEIRTQSRSGEVSLVSSMNQQFSLFAHLYLVWSHHLVNWFYNFCHLCWIYPSITIHVIHAESMDFYQFLNNTTFMIWIFENFYFQTVHLEKSKPSCFKWWFSSSWPNLSKRSFCFCLKNWMSRTGHFKWPRTLKLSLTMSYFRLYIE